MNEHLLIRFKNKFLTYKWMILIFSTLFICASSSFNFITTMYYNYDKDEDERDTKLMIFVKSISYAIILNLLFIMFLIVVMTTTNLEQFVKSNLPVFNCIYASTNAELAKKMELQIKKLNLNMQ